MSKFVVSLGVMKEGNGSVMPVVSIADAEKNEGKSFIFQERVEFSYGGDYYGLRDALCRYLDFVKLFDQEVVDMGYLWQNEYYSKEDVEKAIEEASFASIDDIELTCVGK